MNEHVMKRPLNHPILEREMDDILAGGWVLVRQEEKTTMLPVLNIPIGTHLEYHFLKQP